ncbi:MAG TPA: LLM class F420-dependent oxidoreductase [Candidatus Limnocylindrales bacterium]|nr:LLM class F420-dependent oxidoreductase [Candidatus Limnocylindrales bacterium]
MRVGLQLPSFSWPGGGAAIRAKLGAIATTAEDAGFDSVFVMDHFFQLPPETGWDGPDQPMLEAYTTLGFLAARTERVRLGAMVTGVIYRHPGLLVKTATTLDVLASGRSYLGIGASWYEREAVGLGVPWPPKGERFERLEETLRIARLMWSGRVEPFEGRHYRLREPLTNPMPLARPHPPIMIGGNGEKRTLRLVALYGDACNILVPDPGESARKLAILKEHCEATGRDYATIEKTSLVEVDLRDRHMTPAEVIDRLRGQQQEGIEHVIVNMPNAHELTPLERFGTEIIPALAG